MKLYSKVSVLCFMFFMIIGITVSAQSWKPVSAIVSFKIKNAGLNVDGSFTGLTGTVYFDPQQLDKSYIEASVSAASINTGIDLRNNHLKKEEYFNVATYPRISMKSVSFEKNTKGNYTGKFQLTLKGVTKEVSIPFTYIVTGNTAVFKGSFTLNRLDYGVGGKSWTMGDDVSVFIQLNVTK